MGDGPKPSPNQHYSNHSHHDNSFSTPSTSSSERPDLRESLKSNSDAVIKFKGQEVRAGVVNLTIKVKCNCGSLTPASKRKLSTTPRAAAAAEEDEKSEKVSKYHKRGEDSKTDSSDSDAN